MSFLSQFPVVALSGLLFGCMGKPVVPEPPKAFSADYWGTISARRDGRPLQNPRIWAATRTPCHAHAFDIFVTEFNDQGEELVTFTLANIPQRVGTLNQFRADYANLFCTTDTLGSTLTAKGQAGFSGTYKPYKRGNELVITAFDSVKREIRGTFFLQLIVDERKSAKSPDGIKIDRGVFHTKLKGPSGKYE